MVDRLESAEKMVEEFTPDELNRFSTWFAEFQGRLWDRQIESDSTAGRLDHLIEAAHADFDAGLAKTL